MNKYPNHVRDSARRLWLQGGKTDAEIAAELAITRPDTIRDWRTKEGWENLRDLVEETVKERLVQSRLDLNRRHDQIGAALEAEVVRSMRALNGPNGIAPSHLRQLALAFHSIQRSRRLALGIRDDAPAEMPKRKLDVAIHVIEAADRTGSEDSKPAASGAA